MENGPLQVVPAHTRPILSHHNQGIFCGAIDPDDPDFDKDKIVSLTGVEHDRASCAHTTDQPQIEVIGQGLFCFTKSQKRCMADLVPILHSFWVN